MRPRGRACPRGGAVREYETTLIIQPEISDEGVGTLQERLDGTLEGFGTIRLIYDDLGKRRLAYEIQNFQKGRYVMLRFLDEGSNIKTRSSASSPCRSTTLSKTLRRGRPRPLRKSGSGPRRPPSELPARPKKPSDRRWKKPNGRRRKPRKLKSARPLQQKQ
ncbi:MAG: 30S ribosomal protein S6, partial [Deltaproteobacteria bacterium]|nr:30S ribosomal protein S6 [Deltaproteobacteria bacterium]